MIAYHLSIWDFVGACVSVSALVGTVRVLRSRMRISFLPNILLIILILGMIGTGVVVSPVQRGVYFSLAVFFSAVLMQKKGLISKVEPEDPVS